MSESQKNISIVSRVRASMKSADIEGWFELYCTRLPGYLWAVVFKWLHVHPIVVTLISIVLGLMAAVCFYFTDMRITLLGILLLIWANWYDCADGQLARMTNQKTLIGRLLDGFGGDLWFFAIYWAIALRLFYEPIPFIGVRWGHWLVAICTYAGFGAHARQCAIADYYRNIHMWMEHGRDRTELDDAQEVKGRYEALQWRSKQWFQKLYLYFYALYTHGQEAQTPMFQQLRGKMQEMQLTDLPADLRAEFRQRSKRLMFACQVLTFDERVAVLFFSLLIGMPWIYPVTEITLFEILRFRTIRKHEQICRDIAARLQPNEA